MVLNPRFMSSESTQSGLNPRMTMIFVTLATLVVGGSAGYTVWQSQSQSSQPAPIAVSEPAIKQVTALGRLEPEGEVIQLSAPATGESNRVDQLLVKEGDKVKAGQIIAILDSQDRLEAALAQAQEQVSVAQANLDKVKAGAKQGEINAQKATIARIQVERENQIAAQNANIARLQAERETEIAAQQATVARLQAERETEIAAQQATIARLEAEVQNAQVEYQRYEMLFQEGADSASVRDSKGLALETAQQQLKEAQANLNRIQASKTEQIQEANANLSRIQASKTEQIQEAKANLDRITLGQQEQVYEAEATLDRIAEVRPVDINASQAEVRHAEAAVKQAQANLEQAYVRSPMDGQILKIRTHAGEKVSSEGIVDLGQTGQMYAVAEVYESDVAKIKLGQPATITSETLPEALKGTVEQIGLQVKRQNVVNTDTSANIDSRVVEVRIRLDQASSQKVSSLTNLQVTVEIQQ